MAITLGRVVTYNEGLLPVLQDQTLSLLTLWSGGLAQSRDKLKPLYLPYHTAYGH